MSLQSNISKFPKHLQHVRLQKEEEEEQWISGEELCTEGSSDEEGTNDVKKSLKKPPSKSLLIKKSSLTSKSEKESEETQTDNTENSPTSPSLWRPKKGSVKLPKINDKALDFESEKWKTEDDYQEVVQEFKKEIDFDNENIIDENNKFSETDLVVLLDKELDKLYKIYDECKKDRLYFQKEVCEKIKSLSNTSLESKNTKKFYEIFKYKSDSDIDNNKIKQKIQQKFRIFKRKNLLRKSNKMAEVFSEKEKERLNLLLSDIDIAENEADKIDENTDNNVELEGLINAFKKTEEAVSNLNQIEAKLKTLQEMSDDADLRGKQTQEFSIIDEENREWKAYLKLTQERFHRIDEKINKLHELDELENVQLKNNSLS